MSQPVYVYVDVYGVCTCGVRVPVRVELDLRYEVCLYAALSAAGKKDDAHARVIRRAKENSRRLNGEWRNKGNRITVISRATISSGRLPGLHCPGLLFLPPSQPPAPPIPVSPGSPASPASPVFSLALSLHPRFASHRTRLPKNLAYSTTPTFHPFSYSFALSSVTSSR